MRPAQPRSGSPHRHGPNALPKAQAFAACIEHDATESPLQNLETRAIGPCGAGKIHLAQALDNVAPRQGREVLFTTQSQLTASLNAACAIGSYARKLTKLAGIDLLIVNDFGLKPLRPPHDEDFHELIAERYERAATIVTRNLDFDEWTDAFPANRMLGAATVDRLRHCAYRIVLLGQSYRTPRAASDTRKKAVAKGPKKP